MDIERRQSREVLRLAHALWQPEELGDDAQAVGGGGLQPEINAARRRRAQVLDMALAVQRDRIGGGKIKLLQIKRVADEREAGIELAGRNIREQQLTHMQGHARIVVAELRQEIRLGLGTSAVLARRRGGKPRSPDRTLAEKLAEIELVAVEGQLDQAPLTALETERPAELGIAQNALGIGEGELAVTDSRVRLKGEIAHRGLRRHIAIAGAPAAQSAQI